MHLLHRPSLLLRGTGDLTRRRNGSFKGARSRVSIDRVAECPDLSDSGALDFGGHALLGRSLPQNLAADIASP